MGLRFILGRAGTGKSTLCLREIGQLVNDVPLGDGIILLVPEQMTHQMEMMLTAMLGGTMRIQVLSFRRLSFKVLAEIGGGEKARLGELGKRMLLRKILLEQKTALKTFAHSVERPGTADLLAKTIDELKTYCIAPADLQVGTEDDALNDKLSDLRLIYSRLEEEIGVNTVDPADELNLLAGKISVWPALSRSSVWVDGFKGFTPQEFTILNRLVSQGKEVTVTLPLDPLLIKRAERGEEIYLAPGEEIFSEPWQAYLSLSQSAQASGTPVYAPVLLEKAWRFRAPVLEHLEKYCFRYPTHPFAAETAEAETPDRRIRIRFGRQRRAEVEGLALELRKLAREDGIRWKEMAVLTRDINLYHDYLDKILTAYNIPFFMDYKYPILHHPLIELILSALELVDAQWNYEPLFRCLKTDFFPLTRDNVDRLENYCLAYGIQGGEWESEADWDYFQVQPDGAREQTGAENRQKENSECGKEIAQKAVNATRRLVRDRIKPFIQAMTNATDVREKTAALYNFLTGLHVPQTLADWALAAQAAGELAAARVHEQVWQKIIDLCDEIVVSLGREELSVSDYALILSSGLENLEIGLTPPGMDQVLIGSLNRSRNPEVKVLFLIGASDGVLPAPPDNDGVFSGEERISLERLGLKLSPRDVRQVFDEEYYIYSGITKATEKFYLTYPLADEEGRGISPSFLVKRLKALFPGLEEKEWSESALDLISYPRPLFEHYAAHKNAPLSGEEQLCWESVAAYLEKRGEYSHLLRLINQGALSANQEADISPALARSLYGKPLQASVTRFELFNRCPFAHYARYGLKLKERKINSFSAPDIGEFFHASLRDLALLLQQRGLKWEDLTEEEIAALVEEVGSRLAPQLQAAILLSSARYRFMTYKLKRTLRRTAAVLQEHARRGSFRPIALEADFGTAEFPGLKIALADDNYLVLQGRIDRIDAGTVGDKIYLRIVDYKSRETDLALDNIYYGINLQLLTYLDVALQGAEVLIADGSAREGGAYPAGFLYFPVIEPLLREDSPLTAEELARKRIAAVRIHGYLLADPPVLEAMDRELEKGASDLLNIKLKRDGNLASGNKTLSAEQFALLRRHLHDSLYTSGNEIMKGKIAIHPYQKGKNTSCTYCEYKALCRFDPGSDQNAYRRLLPVRDETLWSELARKSQTAKTTETAGKEESDFAANGHLDKMD